MGIQVVYDALAWAGLVAGNCATVWFFCRYLPLRWDGRHAQIDDAPELIPYTEGTPDLRGLV